jgi:hypothetical protein
MSSGVYKMCGRFFSGVAAMTLVAAGAGQAAVPPDVEAKLLEMGRGVCPPGTALLYKPMQLKPPAGVKIERDIKYESDPRTVLDVFTAEKGGGNRPVLIYVAGGAGNKIEPVPEGDAFYDNIMYWAVNNGMVGVNVQRRTVQGAPFDGPAKDIATMIQWVQANAKKYKGNPNRIFIWSHSAGNPPVGTYLGHPELYGPKGVGVVGAILMAPANFNIAPVTVPPPATPAAGGPVVGNGAGCQGPTDLGRGAGGGAGAAKGGPGGFGGGAAKGGDAKAGDGKAGAPGGRGGGRGPVDPAVQLAQSSLPGLLKLKIGFFLATGELDPANMTSFVDTLKDQLCKAGNCPTVALFKGHSHMSEVFSPNTPDDSVTGPILKWMKSVKK